MFHSSTFEIKVKKNFAFTIIAGYSLGNSMLGSNLFKLDIECDSQG